jgi:hypothetical protein
MHVTIIMGIIVVWVVIVGIGLGCWSAVRGLDSSTSSRHDLCTKESASVHPLYSYALLQVPTLHAEI